MCSVGHLSCMIDILYHILFTRREWKYPLTLSQGCHTTTEPVFNNCAYSQNEAWFFIRGHWKYINSFVDCVCVLCIYIPVFFFESSLAWLDVEVKGQCWEYSSIPLRLFNFVFSLNFELSISARRVKQWIIGYNIFDYTVTWNKWGY